MLASMAAVCLLTSCEDVFEDGNMKPDGSKPSLTINNPTRNQTITNTQPLRVDITVVDKDEVNSLDFTVIGENGDRTILNFKTTPYKTVVEFDTLVSLNEIVPGSYTLKITAEDNRTNVSEQEVKFTVKNKNK
jgi:predicted secreted protein